MHHTGVAPWDVYISDFALYLCINALLGDVGVQMDRVLKEEEQIGTLVVPRGAPRGAVMGE